MYTPEQTQYLLDHVGTKTMHELSSTLNKTRKSVFTFLRNHGITQDTHPNLCDVPIAQFERIKTPQVAYLLGFIWADGTVRSETGGVIVDCVKDDMDTLEPVFDHTGHWNKSLMERCDKRPSRIFRTYNRALCNFLCRCGYGAKSTRSPNKILNLIPIPLQRYFWRGYFDGDGCIYQNPRGSIKVSICGGHEQDWTAFSQLGDRLNIPVHIERRKHGNSRSSSAFILGETNMVSFLGWMYEGFNEDEIGLRRKYQRYLEAKRHVEKRKISSTGYIGVDRVKSGRYIARLKQGGGKEAKVLYLGTYDTAIEAARAYDQEAAKQRGTVARLNFPINRVVLSNISPQGPCHVDIKGPENDE